MGASWAEAREGTDGAGAAEGAGSRASPSWGPSLCNGFIGCLGRSLPPAGSLSG
jgi:hypothetical protein